MRKRKSYDKKNSSALLGGPVGICEVEHDLSLLPSDFVSFVEDEFSLGAQVVSCQVIVKDLTGTLDGAVTLTQSSNLGVNFDDIKKSTMSLNEVNKSDTLEKREFSGQLLGARIQKGGILTGIIKLIFIVKHS